MKTTVLGHALISAAGRPTVLTLLRTAKMFLRNLRNLRITSFQVYEATRSAKWLRGIPLAPDNRVSRKLFG